MAQEKLAFDTVQTYRKIDANGNLHVDFCPITKTQVAPYFGSEIPGWRSLGLDPERIYYGNRTAEELQKPDTIESLNGIPIQLNHHADYADAPAKSTRIGSTGTDAVYDAPYLRNSLHFQDQHAIDLIEAGAMKELSLGYAYTPIFKPGVTAAGENYDFLMTDIKANHVALVEQGRAGADVLVLDFKPSNLEKSNMPNLTDPQDVTAKALEVAQSAVELQAENAGDPAAVVTAPADPAADPIPGDSEELDQLIENLKAKNVTIEEINLLKELFEKETAPAASDDDQTDAQDDGDDDADQPAASDDDETDAQDDDGENDTDAQDDDQPCQEDDDDELLAKAGLSDASDDIKAAFLKGVHVNDEADPGLSEDSVIRLVNRIVNAKNKAHDAKYLAADEVRGVLGKVRPQAYDSGAQIYRAALKKAGVNTKGIPNSQMRTAYRAWAIGRKSSVRAIAQDRAIAQANDPISNLLAKTRKGV